MGATAQLNVRMSQELKSLGDKILFEAGISPTKLVRLVWGKVGSGREGLHQLLEILQSNDARAGEHMHVNGGTNVEARGVRGEQLFAEGLARLGLNQEVVGRVSTATDWKDMREEAIANRLSERGVL